MKELIRDRTFAPECLYGSARWVCMTLGIGYETFRKYARHDLAAIGMPAPDPVLNLWNKDELLRWVDERVSGKIHNGGTVLIEKGGNEF